MKASFCETRVPVPRRENGANKSAARNKASGRSPRTRGARLRLTPVNQSSFCRATPVLFVNRRPMIDDPPTYGRDFTIERVQSELEISVRFRFETPMQAGNSFKRNARKTELWLKMALHNNSVRSTEARVFRVYRLIAFRAILSDFMETNEMLCVCLRWVMWSWILREERNLWELARENVDLVSKCWSKFIPISSRHAPILKISFGVDTVHPGFDSPGARVSPENLQRGRTLVPRPVSRIVNANATNSRDSLAFSVLNVFLVNHW